MVVFKVKWSKQDPKEELRISGDCEALGNFSLDKAIPLLLLSPSPSTTTQEWSCEVQIPLETVVHYKYALYVDGNLRKFEALDSNHEIIIRSSSLTIEDDLTASSFIISWLRNEFEIAVVALEVLPAVPECSSTTTKMNSSLNIESILVIDNNNNKTKTGQKWPISIGRSTPIRIPITSKPSLVINVSNYDQIKGSIVIGSREMLENKRGTIIRSVVFNSEQQENITPYDISIKYLVITPIPGEHNDWNLSLIRGKKPKFAKFIGHRGSGATSRAADPEKKHVALAENTLASFIAAGNVPGAGGVEFDVHLTSDKIPVIYHDTTIPIALSPVRSMHPLRNFQESAEFAHILKVPVNKLALSDFLRLGPGKRHGSKNASISNNATPPKDSSDDSGEISLAHSDLEEEEAASQRKQQRIVRGSQLRSGNRRRRRINYLNIESIASIDARSRPKSYWARCGGLPTLDEMFAFIPETTGFDVEIKYPDTRKIENDICPMERNSYIDTISTLVMSHCPIGNKRWLFYSSFDVDVCTILSRKQPLHDVFLLTTGNKSDICDDTNCVPDLEIAIRTAHEIGLRGVVTNSKAILPDLTVINRAHSLGLSLISWGAENSVMETVQIQLKAGLDGIITDFLNRVAFQH